MDDWRLRGQEKYLSGVSLFRRKYRRYSETWDHDHCAFCWATFSEMDEDLHEGYTTDDEYHWICAPCYEDFREQFHWQVEE